MESVPVLGGEGVSPNKVALARDETLRLCQPIAERKPENNALAGVAKALQIVDVDGRLPLQGVYGRGERLDRMLYIGCIVRRRDVELDIALEDPTLA